MSAGAERPDQRVARGRGAAWLGRSDRAKVLYLSLVSDYSGAERGQSEVVIADGDALVACPPDTRMDQYAKSLGAATVPVSFRSLRHSGGVTEALLSVFRGLASVREVRGHLRRNPDRVIVYCFQIRSGLVASLAAIGLSRAVVWHVTDFLPPSPLKEGIRLVARLGADRVIAHSNVLAEDFAGDELALRDRTTVIHPGVDTGREVDGDQRPAVASAAIVGHVSPTKHTGLALDIAERVIAERSDFELFVVGRAQYREEDFTYEQMLRERVAADPVLADRIHFVGYSKDVMQTLSQVTMLLHCRPDEPHGNVVLEAMAVERPVVGPAGGGLRETVADGVTGLLYPSGDIDQAARHVLALIADPALARRMGAAGRRRAQELFSKQAQLRATDQLLADVAARASREPRSTHAMSGVVDTPRGPDGSAHGRRVLMLGNGWFPDVPGGLNRYFRDLYEANLAAGLRPRAVLLGPARSPAAGVTVAAAQKTSLLLRVARYAWATRAARTHAEIIDSHFALYAAVPTLAGLMRDRPHVVHFHGPWAAESEALSEELRPKLRAKLALERYVYARAAALIVLSDAFRNVLIAQYGIPSQRIHLIPPGVNLQVFTPGEQQGARKRLGLPRDGWIAVCVRRLVPRMGIDLLLEAWRSFADHPQSRPSLLLIAGDGDLRDALSARASQLGLGENVRFLGRITDADLVTLYQAADVSLVPSIALEGFGLVVIEALACGTPVIVTDAGGLPESVRPLDRSLVVPAGDSHAIARRLLAGRDGSLPLPSRGSCRSYAERFSWSAAVQTHQRLFESLLGASGATQDPPAPR